MARPRLAAILTVCACIAAPLGLFARPAGATTTTGDIAEYGPTAGPAAITAGPDGNLWFVENAANTIGRVTPTGTITEFAIPTTDSHPNSIVAGSDGALWFTETSVNQIGRITTAGTFTELAIPTPSTYPYGIAAGPDGNLWFTELSGGAIGRLTTAGAFTEFAIPTESAGPYGITAGPDGNLWFTELSRNSIGRITTAGTVTEYPLPTANSFPAEITSGPDGNVWFTAPDIHKVDRITTAGVITQFALPNDDRPESISSGPDGNLWVTDFTSHGIVRMTTEGVGTLYTDPNVNGLTKGVVAGPDGNVWFTELWANLIGKLSIAVGAPSGGAQRAFPSTAFDDPFVAHVDDAGTPVEGATVTFTAPGSGASGTFDADDNTVDVVTDSNGDATAPEFTANATTGSYIVTADVAGTGTASFNVTNQPVPNITATMGDPQAALVGTAFATAFQAHVGDVNGNVAGATVTFTAAVGVSGATGTFPGSSPTVDVTTDDSGLATAPPFTANSLTGEYEVIASTPGSISPATYALTNDVGVITASAGDGQHTIVGAAFGTALQAHFEDSSGPVAGATVTFTAPPSGASGTFAGHDNTVTAVTNSSGDATAPVFTANTTDGAYDVEASVPGALTPATFALTNDVPVISVSAGSPQTGLVGQPFDNLLVARVLDGIGGPVVGATVTFEAPSSGPSGTFAADDNTVDAVTDSSGDATAPAFTANTTAGAYHVLASVPGALDTATFELTNTERTITVVAGDNQYAFTDADFATNLVAHVEDSHGFVVGTTVTFTAPSFGSSGTFAGAFETVTAVTDSNGDATAPTYTANSTVSAFGAYSVLASIPGALTNANFPMTNDERPTITSIQGEGQSAPVNTVYATNLVARLENSNGPVIGATVRFSAPDSGASGTFDFSNYTIDVVTDSNGDATAPGFTANGEGGSVVVTATAGGVLIPVDFNLTNDAAVDYSMTSSSPTSNRVQVNQILTPVFGVHVSDGGAPVVGATVTFTAPSSGASGTFDGSNYTVDAVTDSNGDANSPAFTANGTAGSYAVQATSLDSSTSVPYYVAQEPTASTIPITEFPVTTPSSGPIIMTTGPDGNMWFTESQVSKIGRITPDGLVTEYDTDTPNAQPAGITLGPDGNLWFTEPMANNIASIDPDTGDVTEYPIPTSSAGPFFITEGPDHNLWFGEAFANKIGRINPTTHVIDEFAIPTPSAGPYGITSGSDGALWFAEQGNNSIGRITTSGVVTDEFPVTTAGAGLLGITLGSDGNVWFPESSASANKIGRMTPSGTVTEFEIPTPAASAVIPTLGDDGNVWFTEQYGNRLGRITTSGVVTEYNIPSAGSFATGIASGPGGYIWFTEGGINSVGRATIPGVLTHGIFGAKRVSGVWASAALVAPSSSTSLTPAVTVDSTNHGHLVYASGDGIYYATRGSGPANWPAATKVPGTRTGDTQPSIVTKGTTVYVAFHRTAGTAKGIYVSTKVGAAGAWSTTSRAVLSTTAAAPSVGVDATGTVHVAWQQSTGIGYAKRTGSTWSAAVVIAGSASGSLTPSLVVNQAGTASVRVAFSRPGTGIRLATRAASGTWSSAVVTGTTSLDVTPSLAIDKADKLYLVARRTGATAPGIYYFRNRTGVWVKQHVSGTVATDTSPSIAVNAFAATPRPQLAFVRTAGVYTSSATTGNFTTPTQTITGTDTSPDIAIDSNGLNAYLAYGT